MTSVLSTETIYMAQLIYPGAAFFCVTVLMFVCAFTLSFLLGSRVAVSKPLIFILFAILILMISTILIEFGTSATPFYTFGEFASFSEALSTHRWLLFQLPVLLTITNLVILLVYRQHISEPHAFLYKSAVTISIAMSFAAMLSIAVESMI
jgi:hypothetical protein